MLIAAPARFFIAVPRALSFRNSAHANAAYSSFSVSICASEPLSTAIRYVERHRNGKEYIKWIVLKNLSRLVQPIFYMIIRELHSVIQNSEENSPYNFTINISNESKHVHIHIYYRRNSVLESDAYIYYLRYDEFQRNL